MTEHIHRFNATLITSKRNPVLRCACGAWSTPGKIARGALLVSESVALRLESKLLRVKAAIRGTEAP